MSRSTRIPIEKYSPRNFKKSTLQNRIIRRVEKSISKRLLHEVDLLLCEFPDRKVICAYWSNDDKYIFRNKSTLQLTRK